ncbi:MAG: hypothetical protein J6V44_11745 [Methanobrevibacter sp.]|nr:hypothetical protein [Methanobrevibacter sp.]
MFVYAATLIVQVDVEPYVITPTLPPVPAVTTMLLAAGVILAQLPS